MTNPPDYSCDPLSYDTQQNLIPDPESGLAFNHVLDEFTGFIWHGIPNCQSDSFSLDCAPPGTSTTYSGEFLYQDSLLGSFSPTSPQSPPSTADFFGSPVSSKEYESIPYNTSPQSSIGTLTDNPDVFQHPVFFVPFNNSDHSIPNPHTHSQSPPPEITVAPLGRTEPSAEPSPPPRQRIQPRRSISNTLRRRSRITKFRCTVCAQEFHTKNQRQHMSTHDLNRTRFTCNHSGCSRSFTRVHDRNRHALKDHPSCTIPLTPTIGRRTTPTRCDACREPISGEGICPCGYNVTSLN